jgi:hypothetical protein
MKQFKAPMLLNKTNTIRENTDETNKSLVFFSIPCIVSLSDCAKLNITDIYSRFEIGTHYVSASSPYKDWYVVLSTVARLAMRD